MILETTGGIGEEGTKILKQVFRFASVKQNAVHSAYVGRAWARLSCNLQASVAQNILMRSSAWDPAQATHGKPVEVDDAEVDEGAERDSVRGESEVIENQATLGKPVGVEDAERVSVRGESETKEKQRDSGREESEPKEKQAASR